MPVSRCSACPERHIDCAESLGVDTSGITRDAADEAAEVVSNELIRLIQAAHFPNGLGFAVSDCVCLLNLGWCAGLLL